MGQLESAPAPESQVTNVNQNTDRVNRVIVDFTPQNNQIFNPGRNGDQNGAVTHDGRTLTFDTTSIYGDNSGTGTKCEYRTGDSGVKTQGFKTPGEVTPGRDHNRGKHSPDIVGTWRQPGESADAEYSNDSDNFDSQGHIERDEHGEHHGQGERSWHGEHSEAGTERRRTGDNAYENNDRSRDVTDEQIAELMKNMEELMKGFQEIMNKYMDLLAELMKNRGSGGSGSGGDTPQPPIDPPSPPSNPPAPPSPPPTGGGDDGDGCPGHPPSRPPSPPPTDGDTPPTDGDKPPTDGDKPPTGGDKPGAGTDGVPLPTEAEVTEAMKQVENRGASDSYIQEIKQAMREMPQEFVQSFINGKTKMVAYGQGPAGLGGTYNSGTNTITMYETAPFSTKGVLACEMAHNWDLNPYVGENVTSEGWFQNAYQRARSSGISQGDNSFSNQYEFIHHMAKYYSGLTGGSVGQLMDYLGADYKQKTKQALS